MLIDTDIQLTITQKELQNNFDEYLDKAENGISPILIKADNGKDLLLFGWNDYLRRFGSLYTKEQIQEIEEACKNYEEKDNG